MVNVRMILFIVPYLTILVMVVAFAVATIFASYKTVGSENRWLRCSLRAVETELLLICLLLFDAPARGLVVPPA